MENKSHAFIAGLFTVCLVAAALLIVWFLNMDRTVKQPYMIATNLSIPGLNPQATVRFRGLDVGKVINIGFNKDDPGEILIYFRSQGRYANDGIDLCYPELSGGNGYRFH